MEIVTVGPGINNRYARFYYAADRKIRNGLIRSGHNVTHVSDRDVASYALGWRYLGKNLANNKLLEVAEAVQPDLIILFQAYLISPSTLSLLRKKLKYCKIVNIDNDLMVPEARFRRLLNLKDVVDATFLTSAGEHLEKLRADGLHISYIPNCTDQSMENGDPFNTRKLSYDFVYFAGASFSSERWNLPKEVASIGSDIKCGFFGYGKNKILGKEYFEILKQTKFALNWPGYNNVYLYSSDRISQLFGTGRCVCLYAGAGFQRFIEENQAIFFENANDLVSKIRAASHERRWQEIAAQGQQRYRELFNEKRIANYIISFSLGENVSDYEWATL